MKGVLCFIFVFLFSFIIKVASFAQGTIRSKITQDCIFGTNFLSNSAIKGVKLEFQKFIDELNVDSNQSKLVLKFRNKKETSIWGNSGGIAFCDSDNGSISWSKELNNTQALITKKYLLFYDGGNTYCFDRNTETQLWKSSTKIDLVNDNIAYGGSLSATDLKSGNFLWKRAISTNENWDDFKFLADSAMLIASGGLHFVSNLDGKGWDYEIKTKIDNTAKTAAVAAGALILSPLTGFYLVPLGSNSFYRISSNIEVDSNAIYYAGKKNINRFDFKGKVVWSANLAEDLTSTSILLDRNDKIVLLNFGYAMQGYQNVKHGEPFLSCYKKSDGERTYNIYIENVYVKSYELRGNVLMLLLSNNTIKEFDLVKGIEKRSVKIDEALSGTLSKFLDTKNYYRQVSGGRYMDYNRFDSTLFILANTENKAIVLDRFYDVEDKIGIAQAYILQHKSSDFQFIYNQGKMTVLNKNNIRIAEFKASKDFVLSGNKCYFMIDKTLGIIDVSQFSGKSE